MAENKYVVPQIPGFDSRGARVLQDFADMMNLLMTENRRLNDQVSSLEKIMAQKQTVVRGLIPLAAFAGGTPGFIRVSEDGVIISYAPPSGQSPGAHTIILAAITGLGTQGSITWDDNGLITSWVDPT